MVSLLLFSVLAQAGLHDPGDRPGPGTRSACRLDKVNACIQDHINGRNAQLNLIAVVDDKLRALAGDQEILSRSVRALESEARSARVTSEMARRESAELEKNPLENPIFPGGPSPNEIFFLRGEPNSWDELHSADRRARLNTIAITSLAKIAELEPLQRNLAMEIEALAQGSASLQHEKAQRGQQVSVHTTMYEGGCRVRFCSDQ